MINAKARFKFSFKQAFYAHIRFNVYVHQTIGTIWFYDCSVTNIMLSIFRGTVEVNAAVTVISVLAFTMIAHHSYLSLSGVILKEYIVSESIFNANVASVR